MPMALAALFVNARSTPNSPERSREEIPMEMNSFAFFPPQSNWLDEIARLAPDEWGDKHRYLFKYVATNFKFVFEQGKVYQDPEGRFAVWRVGTLTSLHADPIFIHVEKNRNSDRQPYYFKRIWSPLPTAIVYSDQATPNSRITLPAPPEPLEPSYD